MILSLILIEFDKNPECRHSEMLKSLRNNLTKFLPREVTKVLDVSNDNIIFKSNVSTKVNAIREKDLYEAVGFSNGFSPQSDTRGIGMMGIVILNNFFDRINLIYHEYEYLDNKAASSAKSYNGVKGNKFYNFLGGSINKLAVAKKTNLH